MTGPQIEEGYTRIANELLKALSAAQGLGRSDSRVILTIIRWTYGWRRKKAKISQRMISEETSMHRRNVRRTLVRLLEKNVIKFESAKGSLTDYSLNKNYWEWIGAKLKRDQFKKDGVKEAPTSKEEKVGVKRAPTSLKDGVKEAPTFNPDDASYEPMFDGKGGLTEKGKLLTGYYEYHGKVGVKEAPTFNEKDGVKEAPTQGGPKSANLLASNKRQQLASNKRQQQRNNKERKKEGVGPPDFVQDGHAPLKKAAVSVKDILNGRIK